MKKLMVKSWLLMQSLKHREEGQGMVEYGLILALIAVVVIGALFLLGGHVKDIFTKVSSNLTNAS